MEHIGGIDLHESHENGKEYGTNILLIKHGNIYLLGVLFKLDFFIFIVITIIIW